MFFLPVAEFAESERDAQLAAMDVCSCLFLSPSQLNGRLL